MIFAKVDVELRDHERAHQAGQAMGTWTWALLWTRAKERDGFVAVESLRGAWAGEKQATKDMAKLVDVGLAEVVSGGWTLHGYSDKNETRADIDKRREEGRERKARHIARRAGNASESRVGNVLPIRSERVLHVTEPEPEPEPELREREASAPRKLPKGSRIPSDFTPRDETVTALKADGYKDPLRCLPTFRDYWVSKAGSGGVKLDWDATFRVWVRSERVPGGNRSGSFGRIVQSAAADFSDFDNAGTPR